MFNKDNEFVVYKHTTPNNKVYIGITSNKITRRWQNGYGYRGNKHFYNAILKYGWDNIKHEILFTNLSKQEACNKEVELISKYNSSNPKYGYNHSCGGECGAKGVVLTSERKKKISEANLGRKHSEETKKKISEHNKGKRCSDYNRQKLSETRKGKGNPMYGKKFSKEHITKIGMS